MLPIESYFNVLISVARADGTIHPNEAATISAAVEASGLQADLRARILDSLDIEKPFDVASVIEELARSATAASLTEAVRDAYVVALADGHAAEIEIEVIDRMLVACRIPDGPRAVLHEWARMAAEQYLEGLLLFGEILGARR